MQIGSTAGLLGPFGVGLDFSLVWGDGRSCRIGEGIVNSKTNHSNAAVSATVCPARGRRVLGSLLLLGLTLATPAAGMAQVPGAPKLPDKTYMSKAVFDLPVIIEDRVRTGLREVQLYVKDGPTGSWVLKEKAYPGVTRFSCRLEKDGEYWFSVVIVDQTGRSIPVDVNREPPGVIVVLDTQGPRVELRALPASAEGICILCDVQDANPNPFQTRFEYQTGDRVWRLLNAMPNQPECFCIPKQAVLTGMVKVTCTDRALNTTVREFNLAALTPPAPTGPQATNNQTPASVVDKGPNIEKPDATAIKPSLNPAPLQAAVESAIELLKGPAIPPPPNALVKVHSTDVVTVPHDPPAVPSSPKHSELRPQAAKSTCERHIINNPFVTLEYKIEEEGKSGIGKVEVWYTRDDGESWDVLCDDPDRKSPVQFKLPSEGVYGIRLVVSNSRGFGAEPPKAGDAPELVIEVDTTAPAAQLLSAKLGPTEDNASIDITWTADDKNLGSAPIDLYYSINLGGPWTPIAKGLRNDGKFRWYLPQSIGKQTYVRLVATDLAGNSCRSEISQPVALDDGTRPHATITGVWPADQQTTPPNGN
jgi:hypothetical protein